MFLKKTMMYPLLYLFFDDLSLDSVVFGDTPGIQELSSAKTFQTNPGMLYSQAETTHGCQCPLGWLRSHDPHADPQLIPSFNANMYKPIFLWDPHGIPLISHDITIQNPLYHEITIKIHSSPIQFH